MPSKPTPPPEESRPSQPNRRSDLRGVLATTAPVDKKTAEMLAGRLFRRLVEKGDVMEAVRFRIQHPALKPDLRGINLSGKHLDGIDFSNAILDEADLSGTGLSGADLSGASLRAAGIRGADLRGANLSRVQGLWAENLARAFIVDVKYSADIESIVKEAFALQAASARRIE